MSKVTVDIARILVHVVLFAVEHSLSVDKTYPLGPVGARDMPLSLFLTVRKIRTSKAGTRLK